MIKVFTPQITPRISYIFEWLLGELVGVEFDLTTSEEELRSHPGPKLSYSPTPVADELWFGASGLLLQSDIKPQSLDVFPLQDLPAFFSSAGALPFDVFAVAFYLVSRYEEYLPFEKDKHGRFPASAGVAKQNRFLGTPVIDRWAMVLRKMLSDRFPQLGFRERSYIFTPTYDVDMAWAYRHKGFGRTMGGYFKALFTGNLSDIRGRTAALFGSSDPYFTFDFVDSLTERFHLKPQWFFHLGKHGSFDKSIRASHSRMKKLIKRVATEAPVGMHPSYGSNTLPERVDAEKKILEAIIERPVTQSRQHFLVMSMPETYRRLIELGVTDEYSMGYSSDLGFRAGTCSPFYFYDLVAEKKTSLRVHPFAIMDATMQYFDVKVSAGNAPDHVQPIINEVKEVRGNLMTLFHNNSFSERDEWIGWRRAYERIVEIALP